MGSITFNNNGISPLIKNKAGLKSFLNAVFIEEGFEYKSISYIFCTDTFLLQLNQQYLKHDTLTDIITFTLSQTSLPIVSEIYISVERVKENAAELQIPYEQELSRVMIHGILHLFGFEDHTKELKSTMTAKENYYLDKMKEVL